ncbi:coiled-coil domain-containing protein 142 [Rhinophrynus dorsalis]
MSSQEGEDMRCLSSLSCSPVRLVVQSVCSSDQATDISADCPKGFVSLNVGENISQLDHVLLKLTKRSPPTPGPSTGLRKHIDRLLFLTQQRHLLTLVRDLYSNVKSATDLTQHLCVHLEQGLLGATQIRTLCIQLRDERRHCAALQRRLCGDRWLQPPSPSLQECATKFQIRLDSLFAQSGLLIEQCILIELRRLARFPTEVTGDLFHAMTIYNQMVPVKSRVALGVKEPQAFPLSRVLEVLAEERGVMLAGLFYQTICWWELEDAIPKETQSCVPPLFSSQSLGTDPLGWVCEPGIGGVLETLLQEDKSQVSALLRALLYSEFSLGNHILVRPPSRLAQQRENSPQASEAALYTQYSVLLWPNFFINICNAFYPGQWELPSLMPSGERVCLLVIRKLQHTLSSDSVSELCRREGQSLCLRLLSTCTFIMWDRGICELLSSALTDKGVMHSPEDVPSGSAGTGQSRTAGILASLCRKLSVLVHHLYSAHHGSDLLGPSIAQSVLCRCVASLQLCHLWLRTRTQLYMSAGALGSLLLVTHGDLPILQAESDRLCCMVNEAGGLNSFPPNQRLCHQIQEAMNGMEILAVSLPQSLGDTCGRLAKAMFQNLMPTGRHWKGKLTSDDGVCPSEYALITAHTVLVPVLDGIRSLPSDHQVAALSVAVSEFMETWMGHVLQERLRFSLQGALQLRSDFESVRCLLKSPSSGLSPEVLQAVLSLPVFQQSDNAVICLLQQPSRKTYLQSRACPLLCCCPMLCRATVESVSDSLQSLDSLERRSWGRARSADPPRQNRDSYLPHSQRQWLSLRVHRSWGGLRVPWEGQEASEG